MVMNLRDRSLYTKTITRNRSRGEYTLAAKISSKAITKDKALKLISAINNTMQELRLVGVVRLDFKIKQPKHTYNISYKGGK